MHKRFAAAVMHMHYTVTGDTKIKFKKKPQVEICSLILIFCNKNQFSEAQVNHYLKTPGNLEF